MSQVGTPSSRGAGLEGGSPLGEGGQERGCQASAEGELGRAQCSELPGKSRGAAGLGRGGGPVAGPAVEEAARPEGSLTGQIGQCS